MDVRRYSHKVFPCNDIPWYFDVEIKKFLYFLPFLQFHIYIKLQKICPTLRSFRFFSEFLTLRWRWLYPLRGRNGDFLPAGFGLKKNSWFLTPVLFCIIRHLNTSSTCKIEILTAWKNSTSLEPKPNDLEFRMQQNSIHAKIAYMYTNVSNTKAFLGMVNISNTFILGCVRADCKWRCWIAKWGEKRWCTGRIADTLAICTSAMEVSKQL